MPTSFTVGRERNNFASVKNTLTKSRSQVANSSERSSNSMAVTLVRLREVTSQEASEKAPINS